MISIKCRVPCISNPYLVRLPRIVPILSKILIALVARYGARTVINMSISTAAYSLSSRLWFGTSPFSPVRKLFCRSFKELEAVCKVNVAFGRVVCTNQNLTRNRQRVLVAKSKDGKGDGHRTRESGRDGHVSRLVLHVDPLVPRTSIDPFLQRPKEEEIYSK